MQTNTVMAPSPVANVERTQTADAPVVTTATEKVAEPESVSAKPRKTKRRAGKGRKKKPQDAVTTEAAEVAKEVSDETGDSDAE